MTSSLAIGIVILLVLLLVTAGWFMMCCRTACRLTPVTMLPSRSRTGSRRICQRLSSGDAVAHAGAEYVVEDITSSFADGETCTMVHLVPTDGLAREQWLSISPGGTEFCVA